jgi:hypothetical protein
MIDPDALIANGLIMIRKVWNLFSGTCGSYVRHTLRSVAIPVSAAVMTDSGCPGLHVSAINRGDDEFWTMEKELNEAGSDGFKIIPQTMIAKKQVFGGVEIVVVMEKAPASSTQFRYRLLATRRTSTMEKEIGDVEEAGYVPVGICSRDEHVVILEKEIK